jgi:hypothetical protein
MEINRNEIRLAVRGVYDLQKMRIQSGNRLAATFRAKLGLESSEGEDENEDAKKILDNLRVCYEKITDGVVVNLKKFKGHGIIDTYSEFSLVETYLNLENAEKTAFKRLDNVIKAHPLWEHYLEHVKGVGVAMAGVIISEFDINKAKYHTNMWKYAGLDVIMVEDENTGELHGIGRCNKKEYMSEVEYTDSKGEIQTKKTLGYNPWLKTKLLGVLATSFLRAKGNYYEIYLNYKNRIANMPEHKSKTLAHRNRMALRYMIKIFIIHLYENWKVIEGQPVFSPFNADKLGIVHTGYGKDEFKTIDGKTHKYAHVEAGNGTEE